MKSYIPIAAGVICHCTTHRPIGERLDDARGSQHFRI